jgi:uncharacterized protein YndB with AHSA1/START domain
MTVTAVRKDLAALTLTMEAEFHHPVERVWQLWADPRQLERWWGPPAYPASVAEHDLRKGGTVTYCMTGAAGDQHRGAWQVLLVEPPHRLELRDWFADADGHLDESLPTNITRVTIEAVGAVTRMTIVSTFPNAAAMEQLVAMGMVDGMTLAMGQIDAILAAAIPAG